jgi:hypothetical protein
MQKFTVLTLTNLGRTLKWLCYLLAGLLCLSILFLGLLLLINLPVFDEELHPDLAALPINEELPPVENNAYYGLMGFRAAADKDFVAAGQALLQRSLDKRDAGEYMLTDEDIDELLGDKQLRTVFLPGEYCHSLRSPCNLEQLGLALRQNDYDPAQMAQALQHYEALLSLTSLQYISNTTALTPAPYYQTPLDAQKYKLAERYNTGSSTAFLNQIADDLRFWKMLLRDGRWIIDKMVAITALWTDMQMLSEYMASHELSAEDRALIAAFLEPLNADEVDIGEAFMSEAQDLRNLLEYVHSHPNYPQDIFGNRLQLQLTLTNATTNQRYIDTFQPLIELSRLSAADFARTVSAPDFSALAALQDELSVSPANLYNLGGKLLLANPLALKGDKYIERIHDLDAMMRAVRLQFELQGIAPEQLSEAISNSSITQPYSGQPFAYDTAEGALEFECRDPWYQINRCSIRL